MLTNYIVNTPILLLPTSRRAAAGVCGSRVEEGGNRDDIVMEDGYRSINRPSPRLHKLLRR